VRYRLLDTAVSTDRRSKDGRSPRSPKRHVLTALTAVATMTLAACGGGGETGDAGGEGPVTLRVATWDAAEETARPPFLELVAAFEAEHPDITIEHEPIPFSDIEQRLLLQVQAGNAPDVAQLSGNYTFNLGAAGALEPLDGFAGEDYKAETVPEALDLVVVDDQMVAAPWALQPVGLWYNRRLLAEAGLDPASPPATIGELLEQLAVIKERMPQVIPLGIDTTNRVFGLDVNWPWMTVFGAEPFGNGPVNVTSPQMGEYLGFMRTLAQENYTEINQKIGYFRPIAAEGNVAFVWDQPILQAVIQQTSGISDEAFHEEWGVTALPVGSGGKSSSVSQDHQLGILRTSENKDAAWTFVDWMTRSERALAHVVANKGALPPVSEPGGEAAQLVSASPALKVWSDEVIPTVIRPPWGPKYAIASGPVMVGVQQMMTGSAPVGDVAEEMQAQLDSALR
jgi:multiple sugar transport system substrate-binding protein